MTMNLQISDSSAANRRGTKCMPVRRYPAMLAICCAMLCACSHSDGDKKPGQTLARVNGEEVTVHQLNEELRQAAGRESDPEAQRKQLLAALVDRQLLVGEALHDKLDRDPNVLAAIERAKAQILAQAYLQSKVGAAQKPSAEDIAAYYQAHPELFAQRKLFDMRQFALPAKDFTKDLETVMDGAKSLDEAAAWLDAHKVEYVKSQAMRTSAELPPQILAKMQGPDKTQLFILHGADKAILISVTQFKDMPVTQEQASAEIAQYLANKHNQEIADAELKRLRSVAKIEYLNGDAPGVAGNKPGAEATDTAPAKPASADAAAAQAAAAKSDVDPQSLK